MALAVVLIAMFLAGFYSGNKAAAGRAKVITLCLDLPQSSYSPKSFSNAQADAAVVYPSDYKLALCLRLCELGRRGMEMGIQGRNVAIEKDHPIYSQAYQAARILAIRQRDFAMSKRLQEEFSKYRFPFIAYVCQCWKPVAMPWEKYYWDAKAKHGVGYFYYRYSVDELERLISKREGGGR